jgi:protein-disulfide isomerase
MSGPAKPDAAADPSALVRPYSPSFGDPGAKVHIVEFFDPACETCASFYPFVKKMIAANPGRIRLSIRYATFHKGSDQIVRLLEASKKQGKYWETLEALLAAQSRWTINHTARLDLAWSAINGVGLQMQKLKEDMSAPELAGVIRQDLQDAAALNVTKTPEFFVNGRPMPSFGYEQLKTLVDQALRDSYR